MSAKLCRIGAVFVQQTRSAFVLKRTAIPYLRNSFENKLVVGPAIKKFNDPKPLREKEDFIYETVRQTDDDPVNDIPVLLLDHIKGLGIAGDVVNIDSNFFRFNLALNGKAVYASQLNLEIYKDLLCNKESDRSGPSSALSPLTVEKLSQTYVKLDMSSTEPWTVEKWHIRTAFRKLGFVVPEHAIELPKTPISGPDIEGKQNKDFATFVTINGKEKIPVRCVVMHRGVYVPDNWKTKYVRVAILPEQKQLLDTMFSFPIEEEEDEF